MGIRKSLLAHKDSEFYLFGSDNSLDRHMEGDDLFINELPNELSCNHA